MFDEDELYILNPKYKLFNDKNRILLISNTDNGAEFTFLHPVHALLLSYFTGNKPYGPLSREIEDELGIDPQSLQHTLSSFIETKEQVNIKYDNTYFTFPRRLIIHNRKKEVRNDLNREDYLINPPYDFSTLRLNTPRSILFVINTNCYTHCTYCYADRKTKYTPLSTERILSIIEEARTLGVNIFDISGGEFLLHPDWEIIIKKLHECGYRPFLSTKVPLSEKTIDKLIETGVKKIQVSLDSLDVSLQSKNIGCNDSYVPQIIKSIGILNKKNMEIHIKSTFTRESCTIPNLTQLLDFINSQEHIKSYSFTAIGFSHYLPRDHFRSIKPSLKQLREAQDFIKKYRRKNLIVDWDFRGVHYKNEYKNQAEFNGRNLCTGNITSFVLLPDGQVTICEELYWNKNFIIGNLAHQSIEEVWNSSKALSLFHLKKEAITPQSACKTCMDFEKCRHKLGVCWKNVLAYHGEDKWDYPDPTCPRSPILNESIDYLAYEEV